MSEFVLLVANPRAGRHHAVTRAQRVAAAVEAAGLIARVVVPSDQEATRSAAAAAAASQARAVIACGGDGTIHWTVQGLIGSATPLGIIPVGTGNDVATALGHDDPEGHGLIAAMLEHRTRLVDVGMARVAGTERAFLGVLSTGFDSTVNERANAIAWPRGAAKYLWAMLRELPRFAPRDYRVSADGSTSTGPGMLVSVGNGPAFGGGMRVCPEATMNDGLLNLTWLGTVGALEFLRVFPRVYSGTHLSHRAVSTMLAAHFAIDASGQVAYADGERIGPLPVDIHVQPRSFAVLDPSPRT